MRFVQRWRPFCNKFEGTVEDFNYGTLLRLDCEKDYTEENTIFGEITITVLNITMLYFVALKLNHFSIICTAATRIQFFAIEIARNREGYNTAVYKSKSGKS